VKENSKYFQYAYSAQNVMRWKGRTPDGRDSAGISAARSAVLFFILCALEKDLTGKDVPKKDLGVVGLILRGVTAKDRGDMRFETKNHPKLSSLKKEGEKILLDKFFENMSNSIVPYLKKAVKLYEDDTTKTAKMMHLAKKFDSYIFARRELIDYNNNMFKEDYSDTYNCLINEIKESKIKAGTELLNCIKSKNNLYKFIMKYYDMDKEYRWDTFERSTQLPEDDDAIHSFRVSAINIFNGAIEKYKNKKKVDFFGLAIKPLFHDLQEVEVGDIIMPIKYATPEMKEAVHQYEDSMAELMIKDIEYDEVKNELMKHFVGAKDDSFEGELTDLADKMDSLIYSLTKANQGSLVYKECFRTNLKLMQNQYGEECFKFFLAYILYDLIK
jgi:putative hydrolase of HD superfamily